MEPRVTSRQQLQHWSQSLWRPLQPGEKPPALPTELATWASTSTHGVLAGCVWGVAEGVAQHQQVVGAAERVPETLASSLRHQRALAEHQTQGLGAKAAEAVAPSGSVTETLGRRVPNLSSKNTLMLLTSRAALLRGAQLGFVITTYAGVEVALTLSRQQHAPLLHGAVAGAAAGTAASVLHRSAPTATRVLGLGLGAVVGAAHAVSRSWLATIAPLSQAPIPDGAVAHQQHQEQQEQQEEQQRGQSHVDDVVNMLHVRATKQQQLAAKHAASRDS